MTAITRDDWLQSPDILVGERDRRLITTALTAATKDADPIDFLLYELDRARIMADDMLPPNVVRLDSIVRYRTGGSEERTVKLVLPEEISWNGEYRLSAPSMHGAALLGLMPGQILCRLSPDGVTDQVEVIKVANGLGGRGRRHKDWIRNA